MAKKSIQTLKEYFEVGKRPTESQFEDVLDSFTHKDDFLHFAEKEFGFNFPNGESNSAIDILFGNTFVNGTFEIEIVGSYANANSVGSIKKRVIIGANPNNWIWYNAVSTIVAAEGPIVEHIYAGDIEWDSSLQQYKLTIYHKTSAGNPYTIKISQFSAGETVVEHSILSDFYTRQLTGQGQHFISFNGNVGIGTNNPQSKLDIAGGINIQHPHPLQLAGGDVNHGIKYKTFYEGSSSYLDGPFMYGYAGGSLGVKQGAAESHILNWKSNGFVGIGIYDPQSQFHVQFLNSEPKSMQFIQFDNYANSMNAALRYTWYNAYCDVGIVRGSGDDIISYVIKFNGTESARFAATGNAAFQGKVEAKDFVVSTSPTADFVFDSNYRLKNINDLESFVTKNKHLPEIPSANEMKKDGLALGEFQIKLLQKIEELTLYLIAQNKEIENLKTFTKMNDKKDKTTA